MGWPRRWSVHGHRYHRNRNHLVDSLKRYLLITQRRVALDRAEDYSRLWRDVRHHVTQAGGRAWAFRALSAGHRFIEFIEWESAEEQPLNLRPEIAETLEALDTAFPPKDSETWVEAKI